MGHWNRAARRSGGNRRFEIPASREAVDIAASVAVVRRAMHDLGVTAEEFVAEGRRRGALTLTDEEAAELIRLANE